MEKSIPLVLDTMLDAVDSLANAPMTSRALDFAKTSLLDWIGVTIIGSAFTTPALAALCARLATPSGSSGMATVFGSARVSDPVSAALYNGMAGHILDFDDVLLTPNQPLHPSAVIAPSLYAAAEARSVDITGESFLRAFILGVESLYLLARRVDASHHLKGWHATATLGSIGATIAAGYILRLMPSQIRQAALLSATQMAGLQITFGTFAKPLQVGKAASMGLTSALLAQGGIPLGLCIEQTSGLSSAYAINEASTAPPHKTGRFAIESVLYKQYPCCGETHDAINAILHLEESPPWDAIETITIFTSDASAKLAGVHTPQTGLAAKFSIPYCTCAAIVHGTIGLAQFDDSAVADYRIAHLLKITTLTMHNARGTHANITLKNGTTISAKPNLGTNLFNVVNRLQLTHEKFLSNTVPLIGKALSDEIQELVLHLEVSSSLRPLTKALRRITIS